MFDTNGRPLENHDDREVIDPHAELSEADLECVVGGLARPWTENDVDEWLVESAPSLL
jgi:hypothetical protein